MRVHAGGRSVEESNQGGLGPRVVMGESGCSSTHLRLVRTVRKRCDVATATSVAEGRRHSLFGSVDVHHPEAKFHELDVNKAGLQHSSSRPVPKKSYPVQRRFASCCECGRRKA